MRLTVTAPAINAIVAESQHPRVAASTAVLTSFRSCCSFFFKIRCSTRFESRGATESRNHWSLCDRVGSCVFSIRLLEIFMQQQQFIAIKNVAICRMSYILIVGRAVNAATLKWWLFTVQNILGYETDEDEVEDERITMEIWELSNSRCRCAYRCQCVLRAHVGPCFFWSVV